jgi:tetratricopeptide (TPR) repeat protein
MTAEAKRPIEVFYSYAREDELLRKELEKHLMLLKRQGQITGWHEQEIGAGAETEVEINKHLNTAQIILLLVSPDYIARDDCYSIEMERALERHKAREARVIPIILRPVNWKDAPFCKLQALPTDEKPVTRWPDRDEAFLDVADGIRKAVKELIKEQWLKEGNDLYKTNRYQEALAAYEQAISLDPDYAAAYNGKGDVLYWLKRYEVALAAYEQAIHFNPNLASAYKGRGKALSALNRYENALAAIEQAIHLNPNDSDTYNFKGSTLTDLGRYEEALNAFNQAICLDSEDTLAYYCKGLALAKLHRYEEAVASYEQVISFEPDNASAYDFKGDALYDVKRYEEALIAYEQAVRLTPDDASVHNGKGKALLSLNQHDEALAAFEQAIRLNPGYALAFYNKGRVLEILAQQAYAKAQQLGYSGESSTTLHDQQQKTKEQLLIKGSELLALKHYEDALAVYEQIILLDPNDALAYNNKGIALFELELYEQAKQALSVDPNYYTSKNLEASTLKRYEEALASFEQAISLVPNNSVFYNNKGRVLELLGKSNEAQQAHKQARQLGYKD